MGRSKENTPKDTREDARLRGGSLIESLENLSAAIDQCTTKSLNFVSIENFLSCLTYAQN